MVSGYLIAAAVIGAWIVAVYFLSRRGETLERWHVALMGPMLMWKTIRGRELIDRIARFRRFWTWYAKASVVFVLVAMVAITALLIWEATIVFDLPRAAAPDPEYILGLPGINPVIPVGYGILALVIGVIIHEVAHGILTRVAGLRIESLGVLLFVVPVGAFVEPNEEALKGAERRTRQRIFSVGPATNLLVAFLIFVFLTGVLLAPVHPRADGVIVTEAAEGSPAAVAGLKAGDLLTAVNGSAISSPATLRTFPGPEPGTPLLLSVQRGAAAITLSSVPAGVVVLEVVSDSPAEQAGIRTGSILARFNGTTVHNNEELSTVINATVPYQTVQLDLIEYNGTLPAWLPRHFESVILGTSGQTDGPPRGYLGIRSGYLGGFYVEASFYVNALGRPLEGVRDASSLARAGLRYIGLPFFGVAPLSPAFQQPYEIDGVLGAVPAPLFWMVVNALYWIFWINLMLGLTNALPAVPLDGGYVFRDWLGPLVARFRRNLAPEAQEKLAGQVSVLVALGVLFLIIWQLIGPRLVGL